MNTIDYNFYPTGAFGYSQNAEVNNYVIVKKGATINTIPTIL